MLALFLLITQVMASCYVSQGYKCSDVIGLYICLRAQDRVNSYITTLNSSLDFLDLNCENATTSTDSSYIISGSQFYSEPLRQRCSQAMKVYETLKMQNPGVKFQPIHCEALTNVASLLNPSIMILILGSLFLNAF